MASQAPDVDEEDDEVADGSVASPFDRLFDNEADAGKILDYFSTVISTLNGGKQEPALVLGLTEIGKSALMSRTSSRHCST